MSYRDGTSCRSLFLFLGSEDKSVCKDYNNLLQAKLFLLFFPVLCTNGKWQYRMDFQLQFPCNEDMLLVFRPRHLTPFQDRNLWVKGRLWFWVMDPSADWNQTHYKHLDHSSFQCPLGRKDTFYFHRRVSSKLDRVRLTNIDLFESLSRSRVSIWMVFLG